MKRTFLFSLVAILVANLVACSTPEERRRRDAEDRREDARWEAERRQRDRDDARRDREDDGRYYRSRHRYWY